MDDGRPGRTNELDLVVVEVDAVGEQRPLVERAGAPSRAATRTPEPPLGVALVDRVLGDVDVEARPRGVGRASTQADERPSDSVNEACAPTMPRASGRRAGRRPREGTARSRRAPAAARSGPSRSLVS